jgi:hypothetical protein
VKPVIQVLAVGLACCLGSAAQAAVVSYTYQAKVSSIVENAGPDLPFINVKQSNLGGTPVLLGDIVTGSFQYDTSVGLGSYQPDQQPGRDYRAYRSGEKDYINYVDKKTGLAFASDPSLNWLGLDQVMDSLPIPGGYAADFYSMVRYTSNDTLFASASLFLDDVFGNAFQSAAMPGQLSLGAFQFATLEGSFLRLSDSAYMSFTADITSLERVELPEPDSAALFAIAAGGLFGLRRMRRVAGRA